MRLIGTNHAGVGLAAFAGAVWAGTHYGHLGALSPAEAGMGLLVAAGAALAPDLDEKHSISGHANPISRLPIFGGHRQRTHCLLAVVLVAGITAACDLNHIAAGVLVGIMSIGGAAVLSRAYGRLGAFGSCMVGLGAAYATYRWVPLGWWLYAAIVAPYFSHLIADQPWQLPLFLPFSKRRSKFALWRVGSEFERVIVRTVVWVGAVVSLYEAFGFSTFGQVHDYVQAALLR